MTDDDRFRLPGSRYEDEEPIAIFLAPRGAPVDWHDRLPAHALWIPESLFGQIAALAPRTLGPINIHLQTRLTPREVRAILRELPATSEGVLGECLAAVREMMAKSLERRSDLVVEGP